MKKQQPAPKIKDISSAGYHTERSSSPPTAQLFYSDPKPTKARRKVQYTPGPLLLEEPSAAPRLFIRGLCGGSIKADFRGLNVTMSEAAFGHWVADESLKDFDIHRGDIALVDPLWRRMLEEGNLVLLELGGKAVLRCVTKVEKIWFAEKIGDITSERIPIHDHPLQGIVLGVIRLFTRVKAVDYRGTDANSKNNYERSGPDDRDGDRCRSRSGNNARQTGHHRNRSSIGLAKKIPSSLRFSEVEKKPAY